MILKNLINKYVYRHIIDLVMKKTDIIKFNNDGFVVIEKVFKKIILIRYD